MNSLVFGRSDDHFWLGLHNENSSGPFRWLTGEQLTYTNWNRDQPGTHTGRTHTYGDRTFPFPHHFPCPTTTDPFLSSQMSHTGTESLFMLQKMTGKVGQTYQLCCLLPLFIHYFYDQALCSHVNICIHEYRCYSNHCKHYIQE